VTEPTRNPDAPQAGAAARADRPFVELRGISKSYPGVIANEDVSLDLYRGEVHCLLGENGAGKSTLISILSGIVKPEEGTIRIEGEPVELSSPRVALQYGVGTVYQHSTLIPALTVLQNLMLGNDRRLRLDESGARARLAELGATLGVDVDPDTVTSDLSLGAQQQIEIVNALWRGSRLLILDEPTSMLTPQGFAELEKVIVRLKANGLAVVFITHKLHEALALGDRVSILRQGRVVGSLEPERMRTSSPEVLREEIIQIMFGDEARDVSDIAELQDELQERDEVHAPALRGEVVLELEGVSAPGIGSELGIEEISLQVRQGEVLGIAGVDGNGQRALAEAVAGQRATSAGDVRLFGASVNRLNVAQRQKLGLRYVTDDRLGEGIVRTMSVDINLFLKRVGERPFWRFGRIQRAQVERAASELVREFDVRTPGLKTRAATLSGGNIQKLLLARELSFDPQVVVFHKPTYGLDLKTTHAVRDAIRALTARGATALVISTDLDELLEICDEIAVLSRGRLVGLIDNAPGAAEQIGALMIGSPSELATPEVTT
jgi:general nucleoside transport system ATP-binding protein